MNANGSGAEPQGAVERAEGPWVFGLLRESGSYRIIAAGPTEGRVRRAMADQTAPTLVATWDELAGLGIGESERRRWLPQASDATTP
jgi:hypothetical protein